MCRCNDRRSTRSCDGHATDICLYVPFCVLFVALGSVQVVTGIFYFISIPVVKLLVNIAIGCWVILTGIGTGMIACLWNSAPRKHELLLYWTVSVLALNLLNLIFLEFGQLKRWFGEHSRPELDELSAPLARCTLAGSALALVCLAFVVAQMQFVQLHRCQRARTKRRRAERKCRQLYAGHNDQSADLEYVIPKKPHLHNQHSITHDTTDPQLQTSVLHMHNKSWVFQATGDEDDDANYDECSVSLCSSSASTNDHSNGNGHQQQPQSNGHHNGRAPQQSSNITTSAVAAHNPAPSAQNSNAGEPNRQRRFSRVSDAASERFAMQMSSFSRCATPSPVPRSGQQSPTFGAPPFGNGSHSPYTGSEYAETLPSKAPSTLIAAGGTSSSASSAANGAVAPSSASNQLTVNFLQAASAKLRPISAGPHPLQQKHHPKPTAVQPHSSAASSAHPDGQPSTQPPADDSPYTSLLAEIDHTLNDKKSAGAQPPHSFSPDNTSLSTSDNKFSSKSASSSKDLEFSKELEAALQLIQELETPSEGPFIGDVLQKSPPAHARRPPVNGDPALARSDSEKTLSAAVSLPSPEAGPLVAASSASPAVSLPLSASMHRLVIDVRAANTTPTSPTRGESPAQSAATTAIAGSRPAEPNGKHVFSVFCAADKTAPGAGSQSTSGYSSPSLASAPAAIRRAVTSPPPSVRSSSGTSTSTLTAGPASLNSFGGSAVIRIASSGGVPAPPSVVSRAHNGHRRRPAPISVDPHAADRSRAASTASSSSGYAGSEYEYRSPLAITSSPASRSMQNVARSSANGGSSAASKRFLLFRKRSTLMPQPDFQSRIFKSDCLAYLSEAELVQRHHANRDVIRNIELNVARRVKGCQPDERT